jgi:hypothetical protein
MLQPDLFFSYGLASGLAIAAGKKLKDEKSPWVNKYFLATMMWFSAFFIPQILYLLWRFPGWESMFAAKTYEDIPAWIVALYPVATLIMAALGFHVTYSFLKKGKMPAAIAQVVWSVLAAVFVVFVGWDGTGYKRLFYTGTGIEWANGVAYPMTKFFGSEINITLLWLQTLILVPYAVLLIMWARENQIYLKKSRR